MATKKKMVKSQQVKVSELEAQYLKLFQHTPFAFTLRPMPSDQSLQQPSPLTDVPSVSSGSTDTAATPDGEAAQNG